VTDTPDPPRLEAHALTVHLGGRAVVHGVDLVVRSGEVLGVFGPSGAGKSTLFRALAGEERLVSGRVELDGMDVTALPLWSRARRGLGYVPQTPSVLWDLTVAQNLAVFARLSGREPRRDLSEALGLGDRGDVAAGSLSGGERRRLELARALSAAPRVLLCDEPFAAIDPHGASRVAKELRTAAEGGAAVIVADHHVAQALELCHRAALLLDGEIAVLASPDDFGARDLVRKHYIVVSAAKGPASSP